MKSKDIARRADGRPPVDSWVDMLGPIGQLSKALAGSEFVPKAIRSRPDAIAAAMMSGRELGLGPLTSVRVIDVIEGTTRMQSNMLLALTLHAGHRVEWLEASDKRAAVKITRADGRCEAIGTYTLAEAQGAGLTGKDVWRKYGRDMLQHRAVSRAVMMACPDVALALPGGDGGMAADAPPPAAPTVVQVMRQDPPPPTPPPPAVEYAVVGDAVVEAVVIEDDAPPAPPAPPTPADDGMPPVPVRPETSADMVTPAQLRLINALLTDLEAAEGNGRWDRTQRRHVVGLMAELPDPDMLESAKDLTKAQASRAIEALRASLEAQAPDTTGADA